MESLFLMGNFTNNMDITTLAQYGTTGVAIALVIALVVIVKEVLKIIGNHMNHNTSALIELKDVIRNLIKYLEK